MTNVAIIYRDYLPDDRPAIEDLAINLLEWAGETNPTRLKKPRPTFANKYLDTIELKISTGKGFLYVATCKDKVIGYVYGYIVDPTPEELLELKPQTTGQIEDLIIYPRYRGQGISTELLKRIQATFILHGCTTAVLYTTPGSKAHKIYHTKGFKDISVKLFKKL